MPLWLAGPILFTCGSAPSVWDDAPPDAGRGGSGGADGAMCPPPLSVVADGLTLIDSATGGGACRLEPCSSSRGCRTVTGRFIGPGTCRLQINAKTLGVPPEEQVFTVEALYAKPGCGDLGYLPDGPLRVLVFVGK
jgi:hypothetical protein